MTYFPRLRGGGGGGGCASTSRAIRRPTHADTVRPSSAAMTSARRFISGSRRTAITPVFTAPFIDSPRLRQLTGVDVNGYMTTVNTCQGKAAEW